ncbi:YbjN domain-containing protein [Actinomyces sp. B33]|uniref:YbjN domain-containing protein n=1 Tax=Actinomyces sp. B33 TaxID=2942131 RepID=UPI00234072BB|nr:YbjN domain-containing protein [Actinomyces sp. B33]MDC4232258.1 YbjN domain-containing protein [Actinomyces sp. B33]
MGLFSPAAPDAPAAPTPPVTQERLKEILSGQDWRWFVDSEGDLGGTWNDSQFYFLLTGKDKEILHIQSSWHRTVEIDDLERVRMFLLQWNHDRLWPKCYHRIMDNGEIRIYAENTVDWEHGATDEQLLQQIRCAIGTANGFYEALAAEVGD